MDDTTKRFPDDPVDEARLAHDPEYRRMLDEEDRKHDDTSEGIDWDEIIASTQAEFEAGDYAFCTSDYPTEEAGQAALKDWIHQIFEKVRREASAPPAHDASGL